jgi:hypothetical protein
MAETCYYRWVYGTVVNDFDVLVDLYEPRGLVETVGSKR